MSSFLLFQQCPTYLARLIWMVLKMESRWLYSCCFVGCCFQDLFNIARRFYVQFLTIFFSIRLISNYVVHPYRRIDTTPVWKKLRFILSNKFGFHMSDNLSIVGHAFTCHILMSFSVDEMLFLRYANLSTSFREPPLSVEMFPFLLKHIYSVLSAFTWRPMLPAACSRLCSRDSA